jgi:hypothetical protein
MNAHAEPVYDASKPEVAELAKKTAGLYANGREFVPNGSHLAREPFNRSLTSRLRCTAERLARPAAQ